MSGEGARITGGRWNPPDSFPVLYTARSVESVVAEFRRMASRQGLTVSDYRRRRVVTYEVSLSRVLDLTQADDLAALGFTLAIITADDILPTQAIGEAAHYVGFEAVLAPSATGVGQTLAVFPTKTGPDSHIEVVRDERLTNVVAELEARQ